ncbi:acetyltransferase [Paenibacillus sp. IB182496]|uniref:Acetyltransferase n=1 Tax=Paenibacillus sabuli TaxID=2772509 RepID=A0A927BZT1_9BACL|nr:DapH/DapD/GlmU-related protein [Paenibacillus sabuli]MBD2848590.1 acetyltransferase [Paenibacillus sabuli]
MSAYPSKITLGKAWAVMKGMALLKASATRVGALARVRGRLRVVNRGELMIGRSVSFHAQPFPSAIHVARGARLEIGDNVFFNYGLDIGCECGITIGDNTIIGPMVNLMDSNYHPVDARASAAPRPIAIGDNVWLGRGTVVLPGVRIGRNTVVAAGSVVTKDIPADVVAGGVPARTIRPIDVPQDWIRRDK